MNTYSVRIVHWTAPIHGTKWTIEADKFEHVSDSIVFIKNGITIASYPEKHTIVIQTN